MNQKENSNDLISRIINDGCQLLLLWIRKKNFEVKGKYTNLERVGLFLQ
jgi:hypothetical protein